MTDVVMPRLSDSMEQGTILRWLKASGEDVQPGEELLEIETDKATVVYAAEVAGTLEVITPEGVTVEVGAVIGRVGSGGSETPLGSAAVEMEPATAAPVAPQNGRNSTNGGGGRSAATPVARRIAAAHGLSLESITGTGPLGRITRADVLQKAGIAGQEGSALPSLRAAGRALSASVPAPTIPPGAKQVEPSRLQRLIAQRMANAKATVPHFQVQTEVTMDAALALRDEFKRAAADESPAPSVNDLIIKAAALALREHPMANGSYIAETFVLHEDINVGMAVAAEGALIVPTIFNAAGKSLGEIAREARRLAAAVRTGDIAPAELEGGTFTVSNLGMFGMTAITPVINPPQAAILGVGAVRDVLARVNGQVVDTSLLTLTLSCDHRILYGADAARFLARIRELLEAPFMLVL